MDRLPIIARIERPDLVDIDDAGMALGAIADETGVREARQVDRDRDAAADHRLGTGHQGRRRVQRAVAVVVEARVAGREADLRQPRALPHTDREGAGRDFGIQRSGVTRLNGVEAARAVDNDAGEHVDAPGRALGVGGRRDRRGQGDTFLELDHRHGAGLEDDAGREIEFVGRLPGDAVEHRALAPRQEARPHPPGAPPEPEVEARGLQDRRGIRRRGRGHNGARCDQRLDLVGGEKAGRGIRG